MDWNPSSVSVKKEPTSTPCQVAEITTSVSPVVKLEVTSPTQKGADVQQMMPPMMSSNGELHYLLFYPVMFVEKRVVVWKGVVLYVGVMWWWSWRCMV